MLRLRLRHDAAIRDILRGLIQGALESPDLSLQLLNVMAEIMELKVLGFRHFNGTGSGERTVGMLYVDDGANTLDREEMVHRAAFVWDVWARLFDTEVNVKDFSKSVVSGVTHKPLASDRHALRPCSAVFSRKVQLLPKTPGSMPETIPQLPFDKSYPYLGVLISLNGDCGAHLRLVTNKLRGAMVCLAHKGACRRRKVKMINPYVLWYGIAHGVGLNLSFDQADRTLGTLARMPLRVARHARRRADSAPRWQLHAPDKPFSASTAKVKARHALNAPPRSRGRTDAPRLRAQPGAPLCCDMRGQTPSLLELFRVAAGAHEEGDPPRGRSRPPKARMPWGGPERFRLLAPRRRPRHGPRRGKLAVVHVRSTRREVRLDVVHRRWEGPTRVTPRFRTGRGALWRKQAESPTLARGSLAAGRTHHHTVPHESGG